MHPLFDPSGNDNEMGGNMVAGGDTGGRMLVELIVQYFQYLLMISRFRGFSKREIRIFNRSLPP
jgi:hypothetical protein